MIQSDEFSSELTDPQSHEGWISARKDAYEREWPKIEKKIETMARKVFLPGTELDDLMSEAMIEAWHATGWYKPEKSSLTSLMWQRIENKFAKLIEAVNTQKRDYTKEAHMPTEMLDWNVDETGQIIRERFGNAGKYSQILMLKSCDRIEKCVILLMSSGFNIKETVEKIREDIDPDFGHKEFYEIRDRLTNNDEILALVA